MSYDGLKPQIMFFSETKNTEFGWVNSLPSAVSTLLPSQAKLCPCTEWKTLLSHSCKNTASFFPLEHGVCSQLVPSHPGTFTLGGDSCAPGAMFCGSLHSVPCCHPFSSCVMVLGMFSSLPSFLLFVCGTNGFMPGKDGRSYIPVFMNCIFCHWKGINPVSHTQNHQLEIL